MIQDNIQRLNGRQVEIVYNGVIYRGILTGASEDELYLQTQTDWVSLPMKDISDLRAAEAFEGF